MIVYTITAFVRFGEIKRQFTSLAQTKYFIDYYRYLFTFDDWPPVRFSMAYEWVDAPTQLDLPL